MKSKNETIENFKNATYDFFIPGMDLLHEKANELKQSWLNALRDVNIYIRYNAEGNEKLNTANDLLSSVGKEMADRLMGELTTANLATNILRYMTLSKKLKMIHGG